MRKLLAATVAATALAIAAPTTSSAGGWVVVSLDSTPVVQPGEDVEVGFTVLRHGVTPESSDDLTVVVTAADGVVHRFDVAQQGAVGHHTATVSLPEAGTYSWKVTGDSFMDADLGRLDVTAGVAAGGPGWAWDVVPFAAGAAALLLAGLAVVEARRARTARPTVAASA